MHQFEILGGQITQTTLATIPIMKSNASAPPIHCGRWLIGIGQFIQGTKNSPVIYQPNIRIGNLYRRFMQPSYAVHAS